MQSIIKRIIQVALVIAPITACGNLDELTELANTAEQPKAFSLDIVSGSGQKSSQHSQFGAPVVFKVTENGVGLAGGMVEFKIIDATGKNLLNRNELAIAWATNSLSAEMSANLTGNSCGELMNGVVVSDAEGLAAAYVKAGSEACSRSALIGRATNDDDTVASFDYILIQSK